MIVLASCGGVLLDGDSEAIAQSLRTSGSGYAMSGRRIRELARQTGSGCTDSANETSISPKPLTAIYDRERFLNSLEFDSCSEVNED